MKRVKVDVQRDHLERMAASHSPVSAVAELVWNSLDADATRVDVHIKDNVLTGIESVCVMDDGHGIDYDDATHAFKHLGGSWKTSKKRSGGGRVLHGRAGEGRFSAFGIGRNVSWNSCFAKKGKLVSFQIAGALDEIGVFEVSDPVPVSKGKPGTEVTISNITRSYGSLKSTGAVQRFTEYFALYLRTYPEVQIRYDGARINPAEIEDRITELELAEVHLRDGWKIQASLTVIEWKIQVERSLLLCDAGGFTLAQQPPGIQAPGFQFTAYLKSDFLRELDDRHMLELDDLVPDLVTVLGAAKDAMREHFRARASEQAVDVVERWKQQEIYPYRGSPRNVVEQAERQVFDVIALNINNYLPEFESSDEKSKKLSLHMLKSSLEQNPQALKRIMQDVLDLPKDKQDELAEMLERTTLSAIISAAKIVADRLDFLAGLEMLVFDPVSKKKLLERKQLHRILAESTWIFGESFNLSVDDQSMKEVLNKHLPLLGRSAADPGPAPTLEGEQSIVDLMLSRAIPQVRAEEREHLVVELKRPSKRLDAECLTQVERYAFTVAEDERFKDTSTRWVFWLVSNDMDEFVRRKSSNQQNRPDGIAYAAEDRRITVWVKTWGQIIQSCKARLNFFQERLQYMADADSALEHLRRTHDKYLPKHMKKNGGPPVPDVRPNPA